MLPAPGPARHRRVVELRSVPRPAPTPSRARRPLLLVAVNYAPSSCAALRLATELASALDGRLVVLRVLPIETYAMSPYPSGAGRVEVETARLEALLRRTRSETGIVVEYELAIAFGLAPHRTIAEMAAQYEADFIVMGAHRSRIKHLFFRDLAERTRRLARCPVLTANAYPRRPLFGRETSRR
jgi:nucleotide-binding universal stress UspA family protein